MGKLYKFQYMNTASFDFQINIYIYIYIYIYLISFLCFVFISLFKQLFCPLVLNSEKLSNVHVLK
ncbi:hypothetical protein ACMBCM_08720, partial [Spiroplasma sp. K1]